MKIIYFTGLKIIYWNHLATSKLFSQRFPWNGFAMWFWMSYSGKGASNSFLGWVTPWPQGFLGVQSNGTNWWHSFHNLSFWIQNHVHQFWLNDFVGRRQMANHDIRRLRYLKIISEYFRMNWNDLAWTVLWTSGKWLPISFCKHDFNDDSAEMTIERPPQKAVAKQDECGWTRCKVWA